MKPKITDFRRHYGLVAKYVKEKYNLTYLDLANFCNYAEAHFSKLRTRGFTVTEEAADLMEQLYRGDFTREEILVRGTLKGSSGKAPAPEGTIDLLQKQISQLQQDMGALSSRVKVLEDVKKNPVQLAKEPVK